MKVNFRTQMRRAKLKNLSDLSFESKIPYRTLEMLVTNDNDRRTAKTMDKLKNFFQCKFETLLAPEQALKSFDGMAYEPTSGVIYFIKNAETGLVKIGFTKDLLSRVVNLSYEYQSEMELVHYVSTYDTVTLESVFHSLFDEKRKYGEWFDLSDEDIEKIKRMR